MNSRRTSHSLECKLEVLGARAQASIFLMLLIHPGAQPGGTPLTQLDKTYCRRGEGRPLSTAAVFTGLCPKTLFKKTTLTTWLFAVPPRLAQIDDLWSTGAGGVLVRDDTWLHPVQAGRQADMERGKKIRKDKGIIPLFSFPCCVECLT